MACRGHEAAGVCGARLEPCKGSGWELEQRGQWQVHSQVKHKECHPLAPRMHAPKEHPSPFCEFLSLQLPPPPTPCSQRSPLTPTGP